MKKLSIKQKQHIKDVLKKVTIGLSIALNIIFVIILIGSLVLSSKQKAQDSVHTEIIKSKEPNYRYNYARSYSDNIITTPYDIDLQDIYGGVYGSPVLSPYVAYNDFSQVLDNSASSTRYIANNSVTSYTILHTLFYDDNEVYHNDYDLQVDIRTKDNTYVEVFGYRINYIQFSSPQSDRVNISINITNLSTNVTSSQTCFYCVPTTSPYPYGATTPSAIQRRLIVEAFSGRYYIPKNPIQSDGFYGTEQYRRFVYLFSQYSIHNLSFEYKEDIRLDYFQQYFMQYGLRNAYNGLIWYGFGDAHLYPSGNFFILEGDFYLYGNYYNQIRYYFTGEYFGSPTIANGDVSVVINNNEGGTVYFTLPEGATGYYYLTDISLFNTFNDNIVQYVYPVTASSSGFQVWTGKYAYNESDITVKAIVPSQKYSSGISGYSVVYDYIYNYTKSLNTFKVYNNFYFEYNANGYPRIEIRGYSDNGIDDYTGNLIDVFNIINIGFGGLVNLLNYSILPGISIGVLIAIPLTLTIVLFVIKLFKR